MADFDAMFGAGQDSDDDEELGVDGADEAMDGVDASETRDDAGRVASHCLCVQASMWCLRLPAGRSAVATCTEFLPPAGSQACACCSPCVSDSRARALRVGVAFKAPEG